MIEKKCSGDRENNFTKLFLFAVIFFLCIALGVLGTVLYYQRKSKLEVVQDPAVKKLLFDSEKAVNRKHFKNIKNNFNKYISFIASVKKKDNDSIVLANLPPSAQSSVTENNSESEKELVIFVSENTKIVKETPGGGEMQSHLDEIDEGNMVLVEFDEAVELSEKIKEFAVKKILILAEEHH